MSFPSVTICNQNRIHCTKLNETIIANCSGDVEKEAIHNCEKLEIIQQEACVTKEHDSEEEGGEHDEVPSSVDIENTFLYLYMDIDESSRINVGHQREDMIKFCAFKGKICPEGWVELK